jgi:serine/threonine protein kinase
MHEGQRLGQYHLGMRIGEGGVGVVYLGLDDEGRAYAVKVLKPHVAGDPEARNRLAREVATLQRLRHPAIAEVLDADVTGPVPYLVTRYIPAPSLHQHVRQRGPLSAAELVQLGNGMGQALAAIHRAGVVHRDLKPANVLMGADPVLIDFGVAHVLDDTRLTRTGMVMGTPGYLCPELITGAPVHTSADWWAWAATMAFAATGRAPFGEGRADIVLDRVRRGDADLDGVPDPLVDTLRRGLRPEPDRRPEPAELRVALLDVDRAAPSDRAAGTHPAQIATDDEATVSMDLRGSRPAARAPAAALSRPSAQSSPAQSSPAQPTAA